jgi:hypothetical protein
MGDGHGRKSWILGACGLLLAAALGAGFLQWSGLAIPARFNPFGPPDLTESPGFLTRIQLSSLKRAPELCYQAIEAAGLAYDRPPPERASESCALEHGVKFTGSSPRFQPSVEMSCPLAAAYAMFQAHVVTPAALNHFGQEVARTLHYGAYSCRQIRGGGRMSEHAKANAIDISGFVLEDGQRIDVANWGDEGLQDAFLRDVAAGSCGLFNVILGPEDNAAHADHFHFDMGPFRRCRY